MITVGSVKNLDSILQYGYLKIKGNQEFYKASKIKSPESNQIYRNF